MASNECNRRGRRCVRLLAAAAAAGTLCACSGSGDVVRNVATGLQSGTGTQAGEVLKGYFRGGNVAGLGYSSGQQSGVTDARGGFSCEAGQPVSFSVGALLLGETTCATIVHAVALGTSGQLGDRTALNIMRLLLILDEDDNFANGITISDSLRTMAESWSPVDFSASNFAAELTLIIADIASVDNRFIEDLPRRAVALDHLNASLSCAYSGVYANLFSSGPFLNATAAAVRVYQARESHSAFVELSVIRQEPVRPLFVFASGSVTLGTLPELRGDGFTADFDGPDSLAGGWTTGFAAQGADTRGTFSAARLGSVDGEYRFTGQISSSGRSLFGGSVMSSIVLTLEDDSLSGEAFDNIVGSRHEVTGRRLPGSNDYEIDIEWLGTATGQMVLDADGAPVGLTGNWPALAGPVADSLDAVGCRLI